MPDNAKEIEGKGAQEPKTPPKESPKEKSVPQVQPKSGFFKKFAKFQNFSKKKCNVLPSK